MRALVPLGDMRSSRIVWKWLPNVGDECLHRGCKEATSELEFVVVLVHSNLQCVEKGERYGIWSCAEEESDGFCGYGLRFCIPSEMLDKRANGLSQPIPICKTGRTVQICNASVLELYEGLCEYPCVRHIK